MEKRHLSHLNGVFFFESMPTVFRLGLGIPLTPAESAVEECHRRSVCCTVSLFVLCLLCFALFCFFFNFDLIDCADAGVFVSGEKYSCPVGPLHHYGGFC